VYDFHSEVKEMSRITKEQVNHVANLARLEFDEEQIEKFTKQLDDIISLAESLNEVDTTNVEPTSHVLDIRNVLREDKAKPGLPREEVLKNAPDQKDGQFRVPSIIE
jgi:aspartyl-tRNA(Asn)/glutamyl-tRNA(Gln) amidotransferase subunit C